MEGDLVGISNIERDIFKLEGKNSKLGLKMTRKEIQFTGSE